MPGANILVHISFGSASTFCDIPDNNTSIKNRAKYFVLLIFGHQTCPFFKLHGFQSLTLAFNINILINRQVVFMI